jgi:hypothetical protein
LNADKNDGLWFLKLCLALGMLVIGRLVGLTVVEALGWVVAGFLMVVLWINRGRSDRALHFVFLTGSGFSAVIRSDPAWVAGTATAIGAVHIAFVLIDAWHSRPRREPSNGTR